MMLFQAFFINVSRRIFMLRSCLLAAVVLFSPGLVLSQEMMPSAEIKEDKVRIAYRKDNSTGYRIIEAATLIKATPSVILGVVGDYENFPEFMPRVKSTDVYFRSADSAAYKAVLNLPWPLSDVWYVLSVSIDTSLGENRWRMLEGSILDTRGYWKLTPVGGGFTKAVYHVEALLDSGFPEFAIRIAQKKTVKDVIKAVKKKAEE